MQFESTSWARRVLAIVVCALALSACATEEPRSGWTLRPADSVATVQDADKAFQDGRFEAAESRYLEIITAEPDNAAALLGLGETYLAIGEWRKAGDSFGKVQDGQHAAAARQGEGIAAMHGGRGDVALTLLQEALARDPALWRAHNALALYYDQASDWPAARQHFNKALALSPRAAIVHNNLGYSLLLQNAYADAAGHFETALTLDPEMRVARNNLRFAKAWQRRYAEAVAGAGPSELRDVLNDVGYIAMLQKDYDIAEAYFVRAMESSPSFFQPAARNLSQVRALKGAPAR